MYYKWMLKQNSEGCYGTLDTMFLHCCDTFLSSMNASSL